MKELQLWQSSFYGYTIIVTDKETGSGYRLVGDKLWAGQTPPPKLLKKWDVSEKNLEQCCYPRR